MVMPLPYFEGLSPITELFDVMQGYHAVKNHYDDPKTQGSCSK